MENKEHAAAANALIQWFNSQEITPRDAEKIMAKVLAKLFVDRVGGGPTRPHTFDRIYDAFQLCLVHEINERLFYVRRR